MNKFVTAFALSVGAFSSVAADSWDMPTPYGDSTFHTVNIRQFAQDVDTATNGALTITVHSAGSLFPHGEIKNAVRSRQVALGEFFLSTLSNEDLVLVLEMSQITPPVGFNLFVIQGLTGIDILRVARAAFPFFLLLLLGVVLITVFPQIVTVLPNAMGR